MNNYTHAYSDYVNHILNKSPSKTAYTFSKAERFPQNRAEDDCLESAHQPSRNSYRQHQAEQRWNTPQKRPKSPKRNKESDRRYYVEDKANHYPVPLRQNVEEVLERINKRGNGRSRSKSPIRSRPSQPVQQTRTTGQQKPTNRLAKQHLINQDSASRKDPFKRSPSKSPSHSFKNITNRSEQGIRYSPSKTFTQHLHEIDHVSKNITIGGYYPIGIQVDNGGKSPISTHRNVESHSFARASSKQRYRYVVKSEDLLGPGYYDNFSEFGGHRKI